MSSTPRHPILCPLQHQLSHQAHCVGGAQASYQSTSTSALVILPGCPPYGTFWDPPAYTLPWLQLPLQDTFCVESPGISQCETTSASAILSEHLLYGGPWKTQNTLDNIDTLCEESRDCTDLDPLQALAFLPRCSLCGELPDPRAMPATAPASRDRQAYTVYTWDNQTQDPSFHFRRSSCSA